MKLIALSLVLVLIAAGCAALSGKTQTTDLDLTNVSIATQAPYEVVAYSQTDITVPLNIYFRNNADRQFVLWIRNGAKQDQHVLVQRGDGVVFAEFHYASLDDTPDIQVCFVRDDNAPTADSPPPEAVCKIVKAPKIDYTVEMVPSSVSFSYKKADCPSLADNATVLTKQVMIRNKGNARLPLSVQVQLQNDPSNANHGIPYPEFYAPADHPDIEGSWTNQGYGVAPGETIYTNITWVIDDDECARLKAGDYEQDALVYLPILPNRPPIINQFPIDTHVSD
jgi:hypothetical protein